MTLDIMAIGSAWWIMWWALPRRTCICMFLWHRFDLGFDDDWGHYITYSFWQRLGHSVRTETNDSTFEICHHPGSYFILVACMLSWVSWSSLQTCLFWFVGISIHHAQDYEPCSDSVTVTHMSFWICLHMQLCWLMRHRCTSTCMTWTSFKLKLKMADQNFLNA